MARTTQRFTSSTPRTALAEAVAGVWLLAVWAALWSWLIAGVAAPAHEADAALAARAPAAQVAAATRR